MKDTPPIKGDKPRKSRNGKRGDQAIPSGGRNRMRKMSGFAKQQKRYGLTMRWLWSDAFMRFFKRSLSVTALSGLATISLFAALGILFLYVRALESGAKIEYLALPLAPRQSLSLLGTVVVSVFFLLVLAFFLRFMAKYQAMILGRCYEEHCAKRAIVLIANHGGHPKAVPWQQTVSRALQGDPRYCGRIARLLVGSVLPLLMFFSTFCALVVLDWRMTLIIAILLILSLPFIYSINVRGARHSTALEQFSRSASAAKRELILIPAASGSALTIQSPQVRGAFADGPIKRHLDAYIGRLRASTNSELLTNIVMGIGLALILGIKGSEVIDARQGWSELAAYLIALRFNLQSLTQVSTVVTSVNRFYPQLTRHFHFVLALEGLSFAPPARAPLPGASDIDEETDE